MQALIVSPCLASVLAAEPFQQNQVFDDGKENLDCTDSDSEETLHKMPVDQLYLKELEFRLAMSKVVRKEDIPLAESSHLVVQCTTPPSRANSANAFACSTVFYPISIDAQLQSANRLEEESVIEPVQKAERQPEYCQKLRQLFSEADRSANSSRLKRASAFQRASGNERNGKEKHDVMTFKQWFLSGPIFVPGMQVIVPKNR